MAKISIFGLTDRAAVLEAMRRYDELGRNEFLRVHGYGPARGYFVHHEGRAYDAKAIAGVAYGIQHGVEVTHGQFSSGLETVAKALVRLGFSVSDSRSGDQVYRSSVPRSWAAQSSAPWDADEMLLALHWYLRFPAEAWGPDSSGAILLSGILERRATLRGRANAARARTPAMIASQIALFAALDPTRDHGDGAEPSPAHVDAWTRWANDYDKRIAKVDELIDALMGAGAPENRAERRRRVAAAWGAEESSVGYRLRTTRSAPAGPLAGRDVLLSLYRGPRRVAPRTAAEPRNEDPELFDRANEAHEEVRSKLARYLMMYGFSVHDSSTRAKELRVDFDLAADDGDLRLVIEAKSMPSKATAEAARLRMGLGQVLWYRHRFFAACGEHRVAVLMVEREPRDHEDWAAVCRGVGVVLTWPERFDLLVYECRCARDRG